MTPAQKMDVLIPTTAPLAMTAMIAPKGMSVLTAFVKAGQPMYVIMISLLTFLSSFLLSQAAEVVAAVAV